MKKFYKVALALAIALGSVSAYAAGSAEPSTGVNDKDNAVEVYSVGDVIYVTNAEGENVTVTSITGTTESAVVKGGQVSVKAEGIVIVTVGGVAKTVYVKK